jgi:flagellar protein FliS
VSQLLTNEALHQKSPEEITALLYEACLDKMEATVCAIEEKDYIRANESIQRAIDILHRLGAGLNYEAGIIADQLDQLYNYLVDLLVEANYQKDVVKVNEGIKLLTLVMSAWTKAMKTRQDRQSKSVKQKATMYENAVMHES